MDTIGILIDTVQTMYSKGVRSDDSALPSRLIYEKLKSVRNFLITQESKKKQKINDLNFIILNCVELIEVDPHNCPCLPVKGCSVRRTKHKLPKTLNNTNTHLISWVMDIESSKMISEITREAYVYVSGNKYTAHSLRYVYEEGYLYIYGKNVPSYVRIKLLPDDPLEALKFPSACDDCEDCKECFNIYDQFFPIDSDLINPLLEMTNESLITKFNQSEQDITNNSLDSIERSK